MIEDLAARGDEASLECDVCVVGSGAAGLALVDNFLDADLRVVLLESGGYDAEIETQRLYESLVTGLPFEGVHSGRVRGFGGTTTAWGGQSLPLTPLDFEPREWVAYSGWPLRYEELLPYYERATRFLRTDQRNFDTDIFALLGTQPPAIDRSRLLYHFSKWSPTPDLRPLYHDRVRQSRNVAAFFHANLTRIVLNEGLSGVTELEARSLDGRVLRVRPRACVLCCGGIETARLLLANDAQQRGGIGNGHDLVGRFFQDHPAARVGVLRSESPREVQRVFNAWHKGGLKYSVRLTASPEMQRCERMLNASGAVMFDAGDDSAYEALRTAFHDVRNRRFDGMLLQKLLLCVSRPIETVQPIYEYWRKGRTYVPGAEMSVVIMAEQEPDPESRVLLSDETDALGMRRSEIRWSLTDLSWHTLRVFARELRAQLRAAGFGEVELEPWVDEGADGWRPHVGDQNHHIGTTRMHDSPSLGVVDRDCRVHGVHNLYIASSSVFPTGGHSNPTLTLIALAIRLADRLKAAPVGP